MIRKPKILVNCCIYLKLFICSCIWYLNVTISSKHLVKFQTFHPHKLKDGRRDVWEVDQPLHQQPECQGRGGGGRRGRGGNIAYTAPLLLLWLDHIFLFRTWLTPPQLSRRSVQSPTALLTKPSLTSATTGNTRLSLSIILSLCSW